MEALRWRRMNAEGTTKLFFLEILTEQAPPLRKKFWALSPPTRCWLCRGAVFIHTQARVGWVEKLLFFGGDGEVFFISSTNLFREEWFLLGGQQVMFMWINIPLM